MGTKNSGNVNLDQFEKNLELAEIKVSYRTLQKSKIKASESKDAFKVLFPLYDIDTIEYLEQFFLLLLNRSNCVLGWIKLSSGGTVSTVVDPKVIFAIALKTNAVGIILSHNHPSSDVKPSGSDFTITKAIIEAGKLFSILLLDHIIVGGDGGYYSFADEGCLL